MVTQLKKLLNDIINIFGRPLKFEQAFLHRKSWRSVIKFTPIGAAELVDFKMGLSFIVSFS